MMFLEMGFCLMMGFLFLGLILMGVFFFFFCQRLTALQKAYADIILNTAKEAATRIMMSERKAQRFQRELQVAKDEGLRMLLRLKQMMDSKVKPCFSFSWKVLVWLFFFFDFCPFKFLCGM